jgi:TP901 family phage tail tape measure protein
MATDLYKVIIEAQAKGVKETDAALESLGKKTSLVSTATKALGAAFAALGAGSALTKIANDTRAFSSSISELSAITGAAGRDLEFLKQQSLEIGRTTTLSASQAAEAFKLIASAKPDLLESGEALASVTKEAVKLAEAARIDLASAANTVGTSLNQFGAGAEEAARFVNVLAAGSKLGASSISDTALALKNSGAAAAAAGVGFEEANAAIQVLAAGGLKASEAGTGLRNIILKLESDTDQKLRPSVVGLGTALENLAAQNLTVTEITKKFGVEGVITASTLLKNADATSKLTTALTGTNIATEQAATNFDNLDGDLLALNSSLEGLAIALGSNAEPNMRKLVQALTDFSQKAIEFVNSDRFAAYLKTTFNIAEALAILLGVRLVASLVATATAFIRTATAVGVLGRGITLLGGPIGVITIAAYGLYEILQKLANTRVDKMSESLTLAATQGVGAVDEHINNLNDSLVEVRRQMGIAEQANRGFNASVSAGANQVISLRNREEEILQALSDAEERREALVNAGTIATGDFSDVTAEAQAILEGLNETQQQSIDVTVKQTDKYKDLTASLEQQMTQVGMTEREQFLYNQQLKLGADATLEERLQIESLAGTLFDAEAKHKATTAAVKELTDAQQIHKNMVENVQKSFGDLIYKTLDDGKINFKSFFNSVLDGFKRLVAELAAKKIMNAIFGDGGLNGFLSSLSGGFSSIFATIGSSIAAMASKAASGIASILKGGATGSAAGAAASGAAASGAAAGGAAAGGATVGGTLAAGAAKVGSAIAGGVSAVGSTLAAAGSKALALATGPVGLAVLATAALAKVLDSGGSPTSTAGLTMAKTAGMSDANIFQTAPFASGFAPLGFKQNATNEQAEASINPIRQLDASLTEIASGLGFNVDLSGHTFSGLGVEGTGAGTVLGTFIEKGKQKGTSLEKQLDNYASEWIAAVGTRNGVSEQVIKDVIGAGTASGILKTAASLVDGSHADGLERVPFDGYIAELHAGERVQTATQVAATDRMAAEMVGLRQNLNDLMMVVAKSVAKTARIEDRWDKNGLPPTRA